MRPWVARGVLGAAAVDAGGADGILGSCGGLRGVIFHRCRAGVILLALNVLSGLSVQPLACWMDKEERRP